MTHLARLCESGRSALQQLGHGTIALRLGWRSRVPTHCPICAGMARGGGLCSRCYGMVTAGRGGVTSRCPCCWLALQGQADCPDCRINRPAFDRIIAAFDYCEPADILIHRLKVSRRFTDVPMLAGLLADEVERAWPSLPSDLVLVAVPASRLAIIKRGFNPAAEIARGLAHRLGRPYCPGLLCRVRDGQKQALLGREARMVATAQLYGVAADVRGARIAVVDDVLTTGSTMHSIARMLKRSGAASVHGLVLARTPHRSS